MKSRDVAVLLSTYNGEKYVEEQIESVLNQQNVNVTLYIRDDGSKDSTCKILNKYKSNSKCKIFLEKNVGVVGSFLTLIKKTNHHNYYAFCDQDDYWKPNKLDVAISRIENVEENQPAMYFSKAIPVDSQLKIITNNTGSFNEEKVFCLREILLRNNAIGCTIVFNEYLKSLIDTNYPQRIVMHDQWVYAVCLAVGGKIVYDNESQILYRQHENNVVGHSMSIKARLKHSSFFSNKQVRSSMAKDLYALYSKFIPDKNKTILLEYAEYNKSLKNRFTLIKNGSKYTNSLKNMLLFIFEVMFDFY